MGEKEVKKGKKARPEAASKSSKKVLGMGMDTDTGTDTGTGTGTGTGTDTASPSGQAAPSVEDAAAHNKGVDWRARCVEWETKYARLYADLENVRKRTLKERIQWEARAYEALIIELLPILDDLARSQQALLDQKKGLASIKEGISFIEKKFQSVLKDKGVVQIEVKKGDAFDADLHEAIQQMPAPDASLEGCVLEVLEAGYKMESRVIRHAKVITGAKKG